MIRCVIFASVLALLAWQADALAQASVEEIVSSATESQGETVEDAPAELPPLTVTGARTIQAVRREMYAVQDEAYDLFNLLNTDDDYDMICRNERPAGEQFQRRVCKSRLHREADSRSSRDFIERLDVGLNVYRVDRVEIDRAYEHQRELMRDFAISNPEYRALLEKHFDLRQEFEARGGIVRYGAGTN